jgi:hypothetical protein
MVKLFNDNATNLECFLWAATFLGVLYLVYINQPYRFQLGGYKKDGFNQGAGVLGFNVVDDAGNRAGYDDVSRGLAGGPEGFSDGSMEAPVFHSTPFNEEDFNPVSFEQAASEINYGKVSAPNNRVKVNNWQTGSGKAVSFENEVIESEGGSGYVNHPSEGFNYGRAARSRQGLTDRLLWGAAGGSNARL